MGKNIVITGDSHVFFYTQILMPYEDFLSNYRGVDKRTISRSGSMSHNIMGHNIRFIWKTAKTAFSTSYDYLDTVFEIYAYDLKHIDYVVFQFGSTDLDGILSENGYSNTEECIDRLLSSVVKFSSDKPWKPVLMIPFAHEVYAPRKEIERWNDYLTKRCDDLGLKLVDVFNIIDKKFIPESWDRHHLNRVDAEKSLNYLLEQLD